MLTLSSTGMIHAGLATALFPIFDGKHFEIFPVRLLVSCLLFGFSFISFFCGGFLPRLAFSSLSLGVPRVPGSSSCFAISVLVSVLVVSPGVRSGKTGTQGRKERPLVFRASGSPFRRRGRRDEGGVAGGKMLWMGISRRRVFCTLLLLLPRAVSRFLIEREWGGGGRGVRSEVGEMACTGGASTTEGGRTGYVWVVRGADAGVQLGAASAWRRDRHTAFMGCLVRVSCSRCGCGHDVSGLVGRREAGGSKAAVHVQGREGAPHPPRASSVPRLDTQLTPLPLSLTETIQTGLTAALFSIFDVVCMCFEIFPVRLVLLSALLFFY
ncbi:hypothetical protein B0H11DRAFT_2218095 [Mycena galericulata]|nr:hypothetical protein B0H11DRAFT_2218095 [Mycena galericulata]